MDPDEALETLRRMSARVMAQWDAIGERSSQGADDFPCCASVDAHDAYALADAAQALDSWLTRGGFLPESWALRTGRCETVGCPRPAAGVLRWLGAGQQPIRDRVCAECAAEYVRRPALGARYTPFPVPAEART